MKISKSKSIQIEQDEPHFNIHLNLRLFYMIFYLLPFVLDLFSANPDTSNNNLDNQFRISFEQIDNIGLKYPQLLTQKKLRTIRNRLAVMQEEISVLMLLGRSRDSDCNSDPTFCIGQTIVNVTQTQFGYINAADPTIRSSIIERELSNSLADGLRQTIMIDSLEKLPGSEVMSLFQFVDKDETNKRRGMILFVVYSDGYVERREDRARKMREADIVENILADRWSSFVPKDSLTSVISRLCRSVVKILQL